VVASADVSAAALSILQLLLLHPVASVCGRSLREQTVLDLAAAGLQSAGYTSVCVQDATAFLPKFCHTRYNFPLLPPLVSEPQAALCRWGHGCRAVYTRTPCFPSRLAAAADTAPGSTSDADILHHDEVWESLILAIESKRVRSGLAADKCCR